MAPEDQDDAARKVARDMVSLKHVEVNAQKTASTGLSDALLHHQAMRRPNLSALQAVLLQAFQKKRMDLTRLMIVVNTGRKTSGLPQLTVEEITAELDTLIHGGFLTLQLVEYEGQVNKIYVLTEEGEQFIL
jgi:predicted transcriptional regulator